MPELNDYIYIYKKFLKGFEYDEIKKELEEEINTYPRTYVANWAKGCLQALEVINNNFPKDSIIIEELDYSYKIFFIDNKGNENIIKISKQTENKLDTFITGRKYNYSTDKQLEILKKLNFKEVKKAKLIVDDKGNILNENKQTIYSSKRKNFARRMKISEWLALNDYKEMIAKYGTSRY
jgi:hypothetical protein